MLSPKMVKFRLISNFWRYSLEKSRLHVRVTRGMSFGISLILLYLSSVGGIAFQHSGKAVHDRVHAIQKSEFAEVKASPPEIVLDVRYFGTENFTGRNVPGYMFPKVYLTREAYARLEEVVVLLGKQGLGIKIFDGYRPQKAVDFFVKWALIPGDTLKKRDYYPGIKKSLLFSEGYIAEKSGHSRGSTIDLTLISLKNGEELDMGTGYDFFGPESHPLSQRVSTTARANRMILRHAMMACGFKPLSTEWWHFTLVDEPFPDTYFDFDIR